MESLIYKLLKYYLPTDKCIFFYFFPKKDSKVIKKKKCIGDYWQCVLYIANNFLYISAGFINRCSFLITGKQDGENCEYTQQYTQKFSTFMWWKKRGLSNNVGKLEHCTNMPFCSFKPTLTFYKVFLSHFPKCFAFFPLFEYNLAFLFVLFPFFFGFSFMQQIF